MLKKVFSKSRSRFVWNDNEQQREGRDDGPKDFQTRRYLDIVKHYSSRLLLIHAWRRTPFMPKGHRFGHTQGGSEGNKNDVALRLLVIDQLNVLDSFDPCTKSHAAPRWECPS